MEGNWKIAGAVIAAVLVSSVFAGVLLAVRGKVVSVPVKTIPPWTANEGDKAFIDLSVEGTYNVLIGQTLNFSRTGHTIIGVTPEYIEGKTYGTTSHNYHTESYFTIEGIYHVEGTNVNLSVTAPIFEIDVEDEEGKSIESTTLRSKITIDFNTNLIAIDNKTIRDKMGDDMVEIWYRDPTGHEYQEFYGDLSDAFNYVIDTSEWEYTGEYEIWVETADDGDSARDLYLISNVETLTVREYEISLEVEKRELTEQEDVKFTVTAPPYTIFNFSVNHPEDVVVTDGGDDPLNLTGHSDNAYYPAPTSCPPSCIHETTLSNVSGIPAIYEEGKFTAMTDEDGKCEIVIHFTDDRTYTVRAWFNYDDPTSLPRGTYWDAYERARDWIDVDVQELEVTIDLTPNPAEVGEDVIIHGYVPAGRTVDIYIDEILEFNDVSVTDNEFEEIWDTEGQTAGGKDVRVYVDCPYSYTYEDDLNNIPEFADEDGSATLMLIAPGLSCDQVTNVVAAEDDDYTVIGNATGVDEVDIIIVGPDGYEGGGLSVRNGLYITTDSVAEDNTFEEDITIPDDADTGRYVCIVTSPGRDGQYGSSPYGEGDIESALMWEYGSTSMDEFLRWIVGRDPDWVLSLVKGATVDKAGSDDLMCVLYFKVESPYVRFNPVESVPVGAPLNVTGTTNREPGTKILILTIAGPMDLPSVVAEVEWISKDQGAFEATIDTTGAIPGTYILEADDRDGNTDTITVEILEAVPTPTPTLTPSPTPTPTPPYTFDTGEPSDPYPSISGVHRGTITPAHDVIASKLLVYPCVGTGGHAEYVRIWGNGVDAHAIWNGYGGEDWNILHFNRTFTLEAGKEYNFTIKTGSYPQIFHEEVLEALDGSIVRCEEFVDANGKRHKWIPAFKIYA